MIENFVPRPEETNVEIDRVMSEETLILDGLANAVHRGWITEDQKSEWLNEYIEKRNGYNIRPA